MRADSNGGFLFRPMSALSALRSFDAQIRDSGSERLLSEYHGGRFAPAANDSIPPKAAVRRLLTILHRNVERGLWCKAQHLMAQEWQESADIVIEVAA